MYHPTYYSLFFIFYNIISGYKDNTKIYSLTTHSNPHRSSLRPILLISDIFLSLLSTLDVTYYTYSRTARLKVASMSPFLSTVITYQ